KKMISDRGLKTLIEVDGGVKPDNAQLVADAGADMLVMGSAFFSSKDYVLLTKKLREMLAHP
ncbi:MAG: ribulose-phosphate 3-epimerase, partial [Nitrospirae bacterium CG01_land_8_20_14_3_00_44_22]